MLNSLLFCSAVVIGWARPQYNVTEGQNTMATVCVAILEGMLPFTIPSLMVSTIEDTATSTQGKRGGSSK